MKTLLLIFSLPFVLATLSASGETVSPSTNVIDDWSTIKAPPVPALKPVTIEAKSTAFLVLDMQADLVNLQARPRSVATIKTISEFLNRARTAGMLVAYSNARTATAADIVPPLTPKAGEPVVRAGVDKFFRTNLEKILSERGIKTVIVVGTAANGAVLHTATGASLRGMKVIIPVDGLSNEEVYAEQYTVWHMVNAPGTRTNATLTRLGWINIQ